MKGFVRLFPLLAIVMFLLLPIHSQALGDDEGISVYTTIEGGEYREKVHANYGIKDGIFYDDVEVCGEISGGTFKGDVYLDEGDSITGGTFDGDVYVNFASISGGTFNGSVDLTGGSITGGTFYNLQATPASIHSPGTSISNCTITGYLQLNDYKSADSQDIVVKNVTLKGTSHVNLLGMDESDYKDAFSAETNEYTWVMVSSSPARYLAVKYMREEMYDKVTISFDPNGGTGQMDTMWNYVYGSIQLPYNKFTKTGTTFKEWNTTYDGKGSARKENEFLNTFSDFGYQKHDAVTVYAQWNDGSTGKAPEVDSSNEQDKTEGVDKNKDQTNTTNTDKSKDKDTTTDTGKKGTDKSSTKATTLKKGSKVTVASGTYKITSVSKKAMTAEYVSAPAKKAKITIPASFKKDGKTIKVTSIAANAFSGNDKVTNVTVPNSVTKIGKKAFYNTKKTKVITINANKKLTVGKGAFQKMKKGSVIKIKGLGKKAKADVVKKVTKQITKKNTKVQ